MRRRRVRVGGPWAYGVCVSLAMLGACQAPTPDDAPPELMREVRCEPIVWHEGTDPRGWDLLREQGYAQHGEDVSRLYPPDCGTE